MKRQLRALVLVLAGLVTSLAAAEKLELKSGDRIAIIGNTLADRMQHSGYFEALTYEKFSKHALVILEHRLKEEESRREGRSPSPLCCWASRAS